MDDNNKIVPGFSADKDDSLAINLEKVSSIENCLIVNLSGYIDTYNCTFLKTQIEKVIDANFIKIIFSCADVKYISSTGIGVMYELLQKLNTAGGGMVFATSEPKFSELFRLLGLMQTFHFENSVELAKSYFSPTGITSVFPVVVSCPACSKSLSAPKSGRFRCSSCKAVVVVSDEGRAYLG